ncbi:MAG: DUF1343 domain-containing protein [Bacteroidota bacterium]
MRGITEAFQRSRKEKEQVENVKLLLNHSLLLLYVLSFVKINIMYSKIKIFLFFLCAILLLASKCDDKKNNSQSAPETSEKTTDTPDKKMDAEALEVGAAQMEKYLPLLEGKQVALVVNQTSMLENTHLVDTLLQRGILIKKIFAPEHGFRGEADAGEKVKDGKDAKTGIPLISLYGKNRKPTKAHLTGIDVVVFDIQDVGARFYTYISTMSYVMEACAEYAVDFVVLDRPNPNGHYVDGPVMKNGYESFIGLHPVPVVHGMTVGEYAQMVNGEGWLKNGIKCVLKVIRNKNYDHQTFYEIPIKPSPNLPNIRSVYLYPSLCFFEGTTVSAGRGTTKQFQIYGHPDFKQGDFSFTPISRAGAKYPKFENQTCHGFDLTVLPLEEFKTIGQINLRYLLHFYENFEDKSNFFLENKFFDKLAGSATLRWQIIKGRSEEEIRDSWQNDLEAFKKIRGKYLLYD